MTATHRKTRWGVLGYAKIAREQLIPAILRSHNSEFTALASRDDTKLAEARQRYSIPKVYVGYDALLNDPEIDAVYIPLPNAQHCEWTLRAAARGKHVLCEKPLALNAAECRRMIDGCAAHGVTLMEAFMYRYTHRTRQVREIVRSGVLGEIRTISSTFRFPLTNPASIKLQPALGGGALYDVGCYPVNLIGWIADEILGQPGSGAARPVSVSAQAVHTGGVDLMFSALLKYSSGLIATAHCGFNSYKRVTAEIVGTQGVLEIPETYFDETTPLILITGDRRTELPVEASDRYCREVEDFADAIQQGRPPHFSLAETQRNAEVLDQLFAAAR